ncbi:MAG TPA: asparagine synthase (glutamine-hydrolyzing), partial [Ferruginibacter sp.]|nr:asparagine synthase (glutamine-hydrolyzing) [Ferruginibacter sp.]
MCGIAGIISQDSSNIVLPVLKRMADSLAHRGPDGEGFWINEGANAGFAHRRLAVIDLSATGAQPMHYLNRYTIVYNGEIYNYPELKKELQVAGYTFTSKSDTEVILAAYDCYKENCVTYFDGMFAFAIWDEKHQSLFAARDRFGEKPFYYYSDKNKFAFASEMKALWAAGIERNVEHKMVLNYIALGYVQNPADKSQTFFNKISSLLPAHCLQLNLRTGKFTISNYWQIDKQYLQKISVANASKRFIELFNSSIYKRLRSDVPVGASLSGGLDSSSIAYFINRQLLEANASENFKSFSAIFPGYEKDEEKYIKTVAEQCRFETFTVTPTADSLIRDFEKLCYHQEEPFPSSSIYTQYKVFELA